VTEDDLERIEKLGQDRLAAEKRVGQIQAADVALEAARRQVKEAASRHAVDDDELALLKTDYGVAAKQVALATTERDTAAEHATACISALDDANRALDDAADAVGELGVLEGQVTCPTCNHPVDSEAIDPLISAARVLVSECADATDAALASRNEAVDARGAAARALADESTHRNKMDSQLVDATRERDAKAAAVAAAEMALASAQPRRNGLGQPIDTAAINEELGKLILRRDEWAGYTQAAGQLSAAKADLKEQEARVEALQWAVEKFGSGPESYRVELLGDGLTDLESTINEYLQPFLGMEVVLPTGDTPLSVKRGEVSHPATLQFLSGSEYFRVQLILQYAFARALDFPIMLVDNEVQLDGQTAEDIECMMEGIAEVWPEVRILATMVETTDDEFAEYFNEPWADTWLVRDGQVALYDGPGE